MKENYKRSSFWVLGTKGKMLVTQIYPKNPEHLGRCPWNSSCRSEWNLRFWAALTQPVFLSLPALQESGEWSTGQGIEWQNWEFKWNDEAFLRGRGCQWVFLKVNFVKIGADPIFPLEIVSSPCIKQTVVAMVSDLALGLAVTALTGHLKRALCMHFDHCFHVKAGLFWHVLYLEIRLFT